MSPRRVVVTEAAHTKVLLTLRVRHFSSIAAKRVPGTFAQEGWAGAKPPT